MIEVEETVSLAAKSIVKNKARSALTTLGIVIGVASVILLVSVGQGLQDYITNQFEELGSNIVIVLPGQIGGADGEISFGQGPPNFAGSKLTLDHVEELNSLGPPIGAAVASIELPTSIKYRGESKFTTVAGISPEYIQVRNMGVSSGRVINKSDNSLGRKVVVIGQGIVDELFDSTNPIGKEVAIGDSRFTVIGVLDKIGTQSIGFDINNFAAIPITTAQIIFGNDSIQAISIKAHSKESVPDVIALTERYFKGKLDDDEYSVVDQSSLIDTINSILSVVTAALGGIAAISLVVGGVGIMNIMLVSVTERTREIGLRKAIGAKPADIRNQFVIEAVTLSLFGGAIGIAIGWSGSVLINRFFPTSVTLWSVLLAFGVSAVVGIVFGVAPAIRASKLDPIDALRYE
jgi:putative ABC transport system permease protein